MIITKSFLIDFLKTEEVNLWPSQNRICLPVVNRIYKKLLIGISFPAIKVEKNIICDGHHRYLASLISTVKIDIQEGRLSILDEVNGWDSVYFDEDDWDTETKIRFLTKQDCIRNNLDFEKIDSMIK